MLYCNGRLNSDIEKVLGLYWYDILKEAYELYLTGRVEAINDKFILKEEFEMNLRDDLINHLHETAINSAFLKAKEEGFF